MRGEAGCRDFQLDAVIGGADPADPADLFH